jgi:hypothetical protein
MDIRLKIFIPFAILYALSCGYWMWDKQNDALTAISGAVAGIIIAAMVTYGIVQRHERAAARIGGAVTNETTRVTQTRVVELPVNYHIAFQLGRDALEVIGDTDVFEDNEETGELKAVLEVQADGSWDSDRISMRFERADVLRTRITITCQPTNPLQFLDYGRNLDTMQRITRFLESVSDAYTTGSHG